MRQLFNNPLWLILSCLLLVGCGGEESAKPASSPENTQGPPTRAEVVVEPSQQTLTIDGQPRDSAALVRELLADKTIAYPDACTITIDDPFEPVTRVRFWVDVATTEGVLGPETAKDLAAKAYDALANAFNQQAQAALSGELAMTEQAAEKVRQQVSELQTQTSTYIQSQQGLPLTDESRKQRRYFDVMMQRALEEQIALEKSIEKLKRQVERGQFVTLQRIR